jgi:hypothetical protein
VVKFCLAPQLSQNGEVSLTCEPHDPQYFAITFSFKADEHLHTPWRGSSWPVSKVHVARVARVQAENLVQLMKPVRSVISQVKTDLVGLIDLFFLSSDTIHCYQVRLVDAGSVAHSAFPVETSDNVAYGREH